jgi:hypothetical protein
MKRLLIAGMLVLAATCGRAATIAISDLPEGTSLVSSNDVPYLDNSGTPTTKRFQLSTLSSYLNFVSANGGSGTNLTVRSSATNTVPLNIVSPTHTNAFQINNGALVSVFDNNGGLTLGGSSPAGGSNLVVAGTAFAANLNSSGTIRATNSMAWPTQTRANMLLAGSTFTNSLALTTTNRVLTNYLAVTHSRNCGTSLTAGTLTLTNAGTYIVNFGMSYTTATGTITGTIFTNGVATELRFLADNSVNTFEVLRIQGLFDLPAGCVVDVRLKSTGTETIDMYAGGLNCIQQFD